MVNWRREIKIKDLIGSDDSSDAIKNAARGLVERLPSTAPTRKITKALEMADEDQETALLVFNDGLSDIYDWADTNRVWLS